MRIKNLQLIDGRHEELVVSLPGLDPKLSAVRLLEHIRSLPDVSSFPHALFYYVDGLRRLCLLILEPTPFSGHVGFLRDIFGILDNAAATSAAKRTDELASARTKIGIILSVELALRGDWREAEQMMRQAGVIADAAELESVSGSSKPDERLNKLMDALSQDPTGSSIQWPYHVLDPPSQVGKDSILTVVVDGEEIPQQYREAYIAILSAAVSVRRRRHPGIPIIKTRDDRGEELPLGENLKELAREAVIRAFALLGPSVQARARRFQFGIEISLRRPSPIAEVRGRSLLLPLVLLLSKRLGEQLNLSGIIIPDPSVVCTGDVDEHGNIKTVSSMEAKTERVLASAASGIAYPAEDEAIVGRVLRTARGEGSLKQFPLSHVQDLTAAPHIVHIRTRSVLARSLFVLRQRTRPLGIADSAALGVLLLGLAFVIPYLASWLDSTVVEARMTEDHEHIELRNSRNRTLRKFGIEHTSDNYPVLADVDSDGIPEILYGTESEDPVPSVLFCLDSHGEELWRFRGGFQEGQPKPFDLPNTFNCKGAFVRDLDHDGSNEIVAFYTHTPAFASQISLLTPNGDHVSAFWNIGHCVPGVFGAGKPSVAFEDIDGDTYDEILIPGTNNSCDKAILLVLDPRSIRGVGYDCRNETAQATWQSYVLLPSYPGLEAAMGIRRLQANHVSIRSWQGRQVIDVGVRADLPGRDRSVGIFTFLLSFDLEFVHFHYCDEFSVWALKALGEGKIDFDVRSPEFFAKMQEIEVIPGPSELLLP